MATTSLWRVKGYIGKVLLYAENPEKTSKADPVRIPKNADRDSLEDVIAYAAREGAANTRQLVSGVNCEAKTAREEMMKTKRRFEKEGGTIAYHGYQSFREGEVTPDLAHTIGVKLADELWGDKYEVLVATHVDKESHIHNHFVINTVSYVDGTKFHRTNEDYRRMREASDRLCKEYGLSVIKKPRDKGMNYAEWQAQQNDVPTVRGGIRNAIDLAIKMSVTKSQFLEIMDEMGFVIDQSGKYPKIKHVGSERFVRFKSLGEGYSVEEIIERIYSKDRAKAIRFPEQEDPRQIFEGEEEPVGIMTYTPMYRSYCRALHIAIERPTRNFRLYYLVRRDTSIVRLYNDAFNLVVKHHLETPEQVAAYKENAMREIDGKIRLRNDMRNELKRAERAGDSSTAHKARFNIELYTRELSQLRREVTTCGEVLAREQHVRDNLMRVEQNKFRGKETVTHEHRDRKSVV